MFAQNAKQNRCEIHILKGEESMESITLEDKLKRAAEVVCKQGMVQFPVSDTAIAIPNPVPAAAPAWSGAQRTPLC
jgi:hypothetical protein